MSDINDETALDCLRTAGYLFGVALMSLVLVVWLAGLATVRFITGKWGDA